MDEWVKVRDIGELSPGTAIKDVACELCGRSECRGTVLGYPADVETRSPTGSIARQVTVEVTPCPKSPLPRCGITEEDIERGYVYRLVLSEPAEAKPTARRLEHVK